MFCRPHYFSSYYCIKGGKGASIKFSFYEFELTFINQSVRRPVKLKFLHATNISMHDLCRSGPALTHAMLLMLF